MRLKFSMRFLLVLMLVVAISILFWQFLNPGLYSDAQIERLAGIPIPPSSFGDDVLGLPTLDVVPAGKSEPRFVVFKSLGISEKRTQNFRYVPADKIVFLIWQISPSYDLNCMSAENDPQNKGLSFDDPNRKVYGIRIVKRF